MGPKLECEVQAIGNSHNLNNLSHQEQISITNQLQIYLD